MARISEQISKAYANSQGKTDANLANDSLHLGGIAADEYATKKYVDDHMTNSEQKQKEYIDSQDQKVLNEAKEYTNTQIRNQDFSNFAKNTDLQALDTKLQGKISDGDNAQKAYTDQKTQAIVDDVNANFQDVNNAIGTLNNNMQDLFQSVSNGKSQIAGAITDKGVATSASDTFDTMATNIRAIKTDGGGSTDPNYVNTGDATATANDIRLGTTAYAKGEKIYGTMIAAEYPDGPVIGTDTSDGTAYAGDIIAGKIAYARGQRIVGTLQNTDVEEIYGVDAGSYKGKTINSMQTDPLTGEKYTIDKTKIAYAKDLSYVVRVTKKSGESTKYVESYAINDDGYYIQQTGNSEGTISTKKYRYELSELGLEENETIQAIALGARGLNGDPNKCNLILLTHKSEYTSSYYSYYAYIRVYEYNLVENGVIGDMKTQDHKPYITSPLKDDGSTISSSRIYDFCVVTPNLTTDIFMVIVMNSNSNEVDIYSCRQFLGNIVKTVYNYSISRTYLDKTSLLQYRFSQDDRYIIYAGYGTSPSLIGAIIVKVSPSEGYRITETRKLSSNTLATYNLIEGTDLFIYSYRDGETSGLIIRDYTSMVNNNGGKTINISNEGSIKNMYAIATKDFVLSFRDDGYMYIYKFDVVNIADGETVTADSKIFVGGYGMQAFLDNLENMLVQNSETKDLYRVNTQLDNDNLIGLKYKEQYFYNMKPNTLSAGGPDVRKGKTFIGWLGTPETGTLEV